MKIEDKDGFKIEFTSEELRHFELNDADSLNIFLIKIKERNKTIGFKDISE